MMKKFFNVICVILACLLVLPMFASCKSKKPDNEETTSEFQSESDSVIETDKVTDTDTNTETETIANIELDGEHADLISHSNELKNKVNAHYADGAMDSFVIENGNASLTYRIGNGKKYISVLANSDGASYIKNTADVYIKTESGNIYYSSNSQQAAFPNFYQHGYYYYEIGIEGQGFAAEISKEDIAVYG